MKKLISLALAAITLTSALASCAPAHRRLDSAIALASSDAQEKASWLDERLETFPTDVILGIGSNEAYGVDMSDFESDGYMVRTIGKDTLIFGATDNGLDRAVRVYAKAAEAGTAGELDETYHEGATIKRLVLAGRDISAYTVYTENDSVLVSAAERFSSYVSKATRVTLPVSTNEPKAPYIVLRYVTDESLSTVGYRWSVTEDGLTLEFSDGYKASSPAVGVARFLEKKLDWFGLSYGYPVLSEAEYVSIDDGDNGSDSCIFKWTSIYGDHSSATLPYGDVFDVSMPDYDSIPGACHGLLAWSLGGELSKNSDRPWTDDHPCFLSEKFFEYSYEDAYNILSNKANSGQVIGKDFRFFDIAQSDNDKFCVCKDCKKMYRDEGNTHSASVLTWSNRISEELDKDFPGLRYGVFAYWSTRVPPKTVRPNDLINITFCFDLNCCIHQLNGEKCTTGDPIRSGRLEEDHSNTKMSADFEKWCELTSNMYVWYYAFSNGFYSPCYTQTVRANTKYLYDHDVQGISYQAEDSVYFGKIDKLLMYHLAWDIDMSDEEYDALYDKVLLSLYGDAAPLVREYCDLEADIYANSACISCWSWGMHTVNTLGRKVHYDEMFEISEKALKLADDTRQEFRLVKLSCICIYLGSLGSYLDAYDGYDDERVDELCRRYSLINERLSAFGVDMMQENQVESIPWTPHTYQYDLEIEAWTGDWFKRTDIFNFYPKREMPEHVKEYIEEHKNLG